MHIAVDARFDTWLRIALLLSALICTAASCRSEHSITITGPHCAFADPEFTTSLGICNTVAEYYIANHAWPSNIEQLREQWKNMLQQAKPDLPPEEAKEAAKFFDRFALVELRKKDRNLILHYRFRLDKRTVDQRVTL